MNIAGNYDFGDNAKLSNEEIEAKLKELVGTRGNVSVGSTYRGVPFVTIHEVDPADEPAVEEECHKVGNNIGATFTRAIDGGTITV